MWSSSDKGIKLWAHDRFITAIWRINPAVCLRHISHIWSLFKHLLSGISNIQFPVKSILSTHDLKKKDSEALENNLNSPSITARMNDGIYTVCVLLVWVYIGLYLSTGCGTAEHGRWPILFRPSNTSRPTVTFLQMETTWCPAAMALEARAVRPRWDHWKVFVWLLALLMAIHGWRIGRGTYQCESTDKAGSLVATLLMCILVSFF